MTLSASRFFMAQRKIDLKAQGSTLSTAEDTNLCRDEWKALSEAARSPFEEQARTDRARYEEQMASYVPPAVRVFKTSGAT